jgi:nucleotide-binding universal stress UspA family protein
MILVGVNGSATSRKALRWALTHAARTGDTVEAIMATPSEGSWPPVHSMGGGPHADAPGHFHLGLGLHDAVKEVRATLDDAAPVTEVVVVGDAGTALALESRRADLLVLGSHGGSRLSDVVLGSVSTACVRYSACPVVIVPAVDS